MERQQARNIGWVASLPTLSVIAWRLFKAVTDESARMKDLSDLRSLLGTVDVASLTALFVVVSLLLYGYWETLRELRIRWPIYNKQKECEWFAGAIHDQITAERGDIIGAAIHASDRHLLAHRIHEIDSELGPWLLIGNLLHKDIKELERKYGDKLTRLVKDIIDAGFNDEGLHFFVHNRNRDPKIYQDVMRRLTTIRIELKR